MARPSGVFDAVDTIKTLLDAQTWPAPTFNTALGAPLVTAAIRDMEMGAEHVSIFPIVGEDATIDVTAGIERFRVVVQIQSATGTADEDEARGRLKDLATLVQRAVRDDTTSPVATYEDPAGVLSITLARVDHVISQLDTGEMYGEADVSFDVSYRIGR